MSHSIQPVCGAQVNGNITRISEKGGVVPLKSVDSGRGESN